MPVLTIYLESILPRVEDPLPERIGLQFPFAMAAAGGVLASLWHVESRSETRERAIRWGGFSGFGLGVAFYLLSLAVQVSSA
jgi:hypothetical protein